VEALVSIQIGGAKKCCLVSLSQVSIIHRSFILFSFKKWRVTVCQHTATRPHIIYSQIMYMDITKEIYYTLKGASNHPVKLAFSPQS